MEKKRGTRKEKVIKSGALARFPLQGEVWPALCVGNCLGGTHALPLDWRTDWRWAKQPDARLWALSTGRGRSAGLYNGIISGQPPLQKLSMLPVLMVAAQTVRFPTTF